MYFSSKYNFDNLLAYYVLCCVCIVKYYMCIWVCIFKYICACIFVCMCAIAETLYLV